MSAQKLSESVLRLRERIDNQFRGTGNRMQQLPADRHACFSLWVDVVFSDACQKLIEGTLGLRAKT
jgi:hypothetical protein